MPNIPPVDTLDLIVRGGRVLDPGHGIDRVADVGISNGRIAAIEPGLSGRAMPRRPAYPPHPGTFVIDAAGKLVVPGLIDLHAHVYTGVCPLTVPADEAAMQAGVTTIVSAGDAGANTIEGFRELVVHRNRTRVLAFLHISTVGLTGWPGGESVDLEYLDVDAATRAVLANRDFVIGIKVRQGRENVAENGLEPLRRAVEVGNRTGVPVMIHIGAAPSPLREMLAILRPGDIVTHCYTGSGNGLVENGQLIPEALPAQKRGIVFDVGHGYGSFDYDLVEVAIAAGLWPDCISTDLHSLSATGPVGNLTTTMSKLLNLGMKLEDVITAVTARPAAVLGRSDTLGAIEVGRVADLTVLELNRDGTEFRDAFGHTRRGEYLLRASSTIRAGIPWGKPQPHPGHLVGFIPD